MNLYLIRKSFIAVFSGLVISMVVVGTVPVKAGPMPSWNTKASPSQSGKQITLYCPNAYLGVRGDLLPTHWEVLKGKKPLALKSSQIQGQDMICVYGEAGQTAEGSVRRLVPAGYKCISDGGGTFKCDKTGR